MSYRKSVVLHYNHLNKEKYTKIYKGICETTFKKRYANHKKSFNVPTYKNDTKLSTEYLVLKTSSLTRKYHDKSKGDTIPKIPFPEDITCA